MYVCTCTQNPQDWKQKIMWSWGSNWIIFGINYVCVLKFMLKDQSSDKQCVKFPQNFAKEISFCHTTAKPPKVRTMYEPKIIYSNFFAHTYSEKPWCQTATAPKAFFTSSCDWIVKFFTYLLFSLHSWIDFVLKFMIIYSKSDFKILEAMMF